jgi:hypothetical protein
MSYSRWSDECFQSDVYVYESRGGFVIHMAVSRYLSEEPRPEKPRGESVEDHLAYRTASLEWATRARKEPIGLPHDGEDFGLASARECAEKLLELREAGYYVPQHAIDALMEEAGDG